jgi:hypothetical protein
MSHLNYYDQTIDSTPLPQFVEAKTAKRKAFSAFCRGAVLGAILATGAFVASAALGETITIGSIYINGAAQQGTTVTIEPSDVPGEWARVAFSNAHVNQGADTGTYVLPFDGVSIPTVFTWDADPVLGSDRITLTPPDGIICIPEDCSVTVPEGMSGEIVLLDWRGM